MSRLKSMMSRAATLLSVIALTAGTRSTQLRHVMSKIDADASKAEAVKMAKAVEEAAAAESLRNKLAGGGTRDPQRKLGDNLGDEGQAGKNPDNGDMQRINGTSEKNESEPADMRVAGPLEVSKNGAAGAGCTDNQERNMDQGQMETDEGTDMEIEEILSQVSERQQDNLATPNMELKRQRPISRRSKRARSPSDSPVARKLQNMGNINEDLDNVHWAQTRDAARSQSTLSSEDEASLSRSLSDDGYLEIIDKLVQLVNRKFGEKGLELDDEGQALVNKASTLTSKWKEMPMLVETKAVEGTSPRMAMQSPVEFSTGTAAEAFSEQDLAAKETLPDAFHWEEEDLAAKAKAEAPEAAEAAKRASTYNSP